jgi:hypothetical protein
MNLFSHGGIMRCRQAAIHFNGVLGQAVLSAEDKHRLVIRDF